MRSAPRISKIAAAFAALLLAACAGNETQISKEFSGRSLEGKTLAMVLPETSQVEVMNPDDLEIAFPGPQIMSANAVLAREFNEYFYNEMAQSIDFVKPLRVPDTLPRPAEDQRIAYSRKATLNFPGFTYAIPSREFLRSHGVEADVVLVVAGLKSSQGKTEIISPKTGGSLQEKFLVLEGWYIIWDYASGKPIANGRFRPTREYRFKPETGDWMKSFELAVQKVMESSPFRGAKWYKR